MSIDDVKRITVNKDDLEALLAEKFGNKIEPVNQAKLQQQKRQRQRYKETKKPEPPTE